MNHKYFNFYKHLVQADKCPVRENRLSNVALQRLPSHGLTDITPRHGGGSRHGRCRHINPRLRSQSLCEAAVPRHVGVLVLHAKEQGRLRKEGTVNSFYHTYAGNCYLTITFFLHRKGFSAPFLIVPSTTGSTAAATTTGETQKRPLGRET